MPRPQLANPYTTRNVFRDGGFFLRPTHTAIAYAIVGFLHQHMHAQGCVIHVIHVYLMLCPPCLVYFFNSDASKVKQYIFQQLMKQRSHDKPVLEVVAVFLKAEVFGQSPNAEFGYDVAEICSVDT